MEDHGGGNLGSVLDTQRERQDRAAGMNLGVPASCLESAVPSVALWVDGGNCAHATDDKAPRQPPVSPPEPSRAKGGGEEAILRKISLKQLRWLDWHTRRGHVLKTQNSYVNCKRRLNDLWDKTLP
ncbi:uncharacterized protein LOC143493369 [Brachyhypopomus gauderio]|uniref:uncharacterized protein LOC143493369 n=1 Tax=Brachyhypopomus gauderio TaxID=698409 RepID=UPI0040424C19